MIAKLGRKLPSLLGLLGLLSTASSVLAQGNTFNPYGNSGYADYREFGNAMYSNNPALPGQALLNAEPSITRPRANSYQQYTNDLEGTNMGSNPYGRNSSSNLPYYQAYQRLNSPNNRYRPGDFSDAEQKFNERQKKRDAAYSAALAEKDPAKRAKLLRQVEQDSFVRPSAATRSRDVDGVTAPKSANTGRTSASATRAPAPPVSGASPTPGTRRTQAPSPLPGTSSRRPSTSSATSPAPSSTARLKPSGRPAPDPSTIPVPPPR